MYTMLSAALRTRLNRRPGMIFGLLLSLTFFAAMPAQVSAGCVSLSICEPKPEPKPAVVVPVENEDVCITNQTRISIHDDIVNIFSDFVPDNPNGMIITQIPLRDIRAVTDEEKATNQPVWIMSKDSEFAPGWHVELYWFDNHYGVVITGQNSFYDDTADCADL